jgi:outer membrane protein assembly factor BamB
MIEPASNSTIRLILSGAAVLLVALVLPLMPVAADAGGGGPLFAVIPTLGIGGPLAILALLFPSLFGGVLLLFRQWGAFFMVFSAQSLLLLVYSYRFSIWGNPPPVWAGDSAFWLALTAINLLGMLWALRRTVKSFEPGRPRLEAPARTELLVLVTLSVICVAMAVWYRLDPPKGGNLSPLWGVSFAISAGVWIGAIYRAVCYLFERSPQPAEEQLEPEAVAASAAGGEFAEHVTNARPDLPGGPTFQPDAALEEPRTNLPARLRLPTEGVMLWAMLAVMVVLLFWQNGSATTTEIAESSEGRPAARFVALQPKNPDWRPGTNMVLAMPWLEGDRLYVAAASTQSGATFGSVYCLDVRTVKTHWTFDDGGQMKQIFSSPRVADGRLYIGEGFHEDPNCKLYCLNAATGEKLWSFTTRSQTESSPCLANGKVFFGAGNEGIYALDARTGQKLWRYGQKPDEAPIFRVGAGPAVADQRLYAGSGLDRNFPGQCETALVCLNANTGKEIWKVKTDLPCWAEPMVAGPDVFFALGNGDVMTDDQQRPAGRILSLDAATGKENWRHDVPNGVLASVAVDGRQVYFNSRDGHCYSIGRFDGKVRWKQALGSPVVAGPVLDQGALTGRAVNVFAVSTAGRCCCLDAATGAAHWTTQNKAGDLEPFGTYVCSTPRLEITPTPRGIRRRLFFGASINGMALPGVYRVEDLVPAVRQEP